MTIEQRSSTSISSRRRCTASGQCSLEPFSHFRHYEVRSIAHFTGLSAYKYRDTMYPQSPQHLNQLHRLVIPQTPFTMLRSTLIALALTTSVLALTYATDESSLVPVATFQKAKGEGFVKTIPRGYEEACGVGGEVDPNFVANYNNARAAGITNIDAYWFPCTGKTHKCKSYAAQLSELTTTIHQHNMKIGTIWIDFEVDNICNNVCS